MIEYIKREDAERLLRYDFLSALTEDERVDELNRIPGAELPERCIAKITFDEDKFKEIADEAIREVVVRCTECRHRRLCDQCTEQNGKLYHIEYCSRGEREEQK